MYTRNGTSLPPRFRGLNGFTLFASVIAACHRSGASAVHPVYSPENAVSEYPQVDAIVVLAGGQDKSRPSGLPPWVERRLQACAGILKSQPKSCRVLCSGGGTPHKPPVLTSAGYCTFESMACAEYLMKDNVESKQLLRETSSYDTIGNGYFAAAIHAIPRRWQSIMVITSAFHMPRSQAIFEKVFGLVEKDLGLRVSTHCVPVSDEGLFEDHVLQARERREQNSLDRFHEDMAEIESLADFNEWLHSTHLCYAVQRQHEFGQPTGLSDEALASY